MGSRRAEGERSVGGSACGREGGRGAEQDAVCGRRHGAMLGARSRRRTELCQVWAQGGGSSAGAGMEGAQCARAQRKLAGAGVSAFGARPIAGTEEGRGGVGRREAYVRLGSLVKGGPQLGCKGRPTGCRDLHPLLFVAAHCSVLSTPISLLFDYGYNI